MSPELSPCYLSPDRMNFTGLGQGQCSGMLLYVREIICGAPAEFYSCAGHLQPGWFSISKVREGDDHDTAP